MIIDQSEIEITNGLLMELNSETNLSFISNITETKLNKMLILGYDARNYHKFEITDENRKLYVILKKQRHDISK